VSRYQKKHSHTHHPDHHPIFISFFHLPRSIASALFKLRAWQCFCTTSFYVLFGLPLGLEPSISYSIHFFTQSVSSFCSTCPYHRKLFCCSINIISSIPSLSLNSLLGTLSFTLTIHIHLTILISARWSATSFSFLTDQVSLPCIILLHTQLLYSLPLLTKERKKKKESTGRKYNGLPCYIGQAIINNENLAMGNVQMQHVWQM